MDLSAWQPALLILVFAGVGLLAAGFVWRDPRAHALRALGWGAVAAYWPFQGLAVYADDSVLATCALAAALLLGFFASQAWKAYKRGDDASEMRWFTGSSTLALAIYAGIFGIPSLRHGGPDPLLLEALALAWQVPFFAVVAVGVVLLGVGFFVRSRQGRLLRAVGWTVFGLYWPLLAPEFFWGAEADPINGLFTSIGPFFLWWIAQHEHKSYQWNEEVPALRWFAGASFVAAATYFIIYVMPGVQMWLMTETAHQSAWMYNTVFFGGEERAYVSTARGEPDIMLPGGVYAVTVILACTAIQSIMIFVGAIACLDAPQRQKIKAYLITVPTIYVLNLFRNAGIVYGYKDLDWGMFGIGSFEWMHSYVGKIGSLVAMVVIALAVFATLPELHGNILDIFDLRKRKAPGFFNRPPPPPSKTEPATPPAEA